jgi:hypothetical protein
MVVGRSFIKSVVIITCTIITKIGGLSLRRFIALLGRYRRKGKPKASVSIKGGSICLIVDGEYWDA